VRILRELIAAAAGATVGYLLFREHRGRKLAERMAAATLESLLNAIDANDEETGAHVRRVAAYALVIARALDLTREQCREVERAALFHDIGKIHEALFDLVHEPNRLTPAEFKLVSTHTERGADVLEPLTAFYPALADAVRSHHERWDGSGYPQGLVGEAIPPIARVIAIADSFDAITHKRRYSRGQHASDAARVFEEERGTHFDPELIDLVLLPPVFEALENAHRELHRRSRKRGERRTEGVDHDNVPEVAFRWRQSGTDPELTNN
jgi:putative nucleotidyltransferase with HDIG domain